MPMSVMHIRHMRMSVDHRFMPVHMAVGAARHRFVRMGMVAVVVGVRVLVFERRMQVFMAVPLRQMQDHAGQHQRRAGAEPD